MCFHVRIIWCACEFLTGEMRHTQPAVNNSQTISSTNNVWMLDSSKLSNVLDDIPIKPTRAQLPRKKYTKLPRGAKNLFKSCLDWHLRSLMKIQFYACFTSLQSFNFENTSHWNGSSSKISIHSELFRSAHIHLLIQNRKPTKQSMTNIFFSGYRFHFIIRYYEYIFITHYTKPIFGSACVRAQQNHS